MISEKNSYLFSFFIIIVCIVVHFFWGSNPFVLFVAAIAVILGLFPIVLFGPFNIGPLLIFLLGFRYVGFPLFAKLVYGQALDTNLEEPLSSFLAIMIGLFAYLLAFLIANKSDIGAPLFYPEEKAYCLRRISLVAFIFGFAANITNTLHINSYKDAWNISSYFLSFLHLALISAAANAFVVSKGHRLINWWTLLILLTELIFAFLYNSRTLIFETIIALALTDFAFRKKVSVKRFVFTISALLFIIVVLSPIFLYIRAFRENANWKDRIILPIEALGNWRDVEEHLYDYNYRMSNKDNYSFGYYGIPVNFIERFSLVGNTDMLIKGANNIGFLGFEVVNHAIKYATPRFFVPDKPIDYSEGDWMQYMYVGDYMYGSFLLVSLIGVSYVSCGWIGVFVFPLIAGLCVFFLIKKIHGLNITNNIWAIYMFVIINNQFVEGGAWANAAIIFRQIPQVAIIMLIMMYVIKGNYIVVKKID